MKRREFIILGGIGATSASLLSACGHPEEKLIPALIPDQDYVPGIDYWKASTCGMCPAGCGILVRTREHKANKIEGNPLHPVNRGALCAKGQAGLEVLYNPDRIRGPMKRVGERGEGKWQEISWDEALKTVADKLREIKAQGQADKIVFATSDLNGVTGAAIHSFMSAYGARILLASESPKDSIWNSSYQMSYGASQTPIFDIANATYLLSFGARFLETWHSPVMFSLAYGEFRRTKGKARGKFVQVEPRMSLTGANADEWLPARIGADGLVALAIAQVITRENLIKDAEKPTFTSGSLEDYAPEKTEALTDVEPEKIIRIAREFASSERALAVCGGSVGALGKDGQSPFLAINFLNILRGNINKPGGVLLSSYAYFDLMGKVRPLMGNVRSNVSVSSQESSRDSVDSTEGYVDLSLPKPYTALFLHQMNPVFSDPRTIDTIKSIPFIVKFGSFLDETAQFADIILPDRTYLDSWNLKAISLTEKKMAVTITQPIEKSDVDSRQAADVVLALAREFDPTARSFDSAEDIVKQVVAATLNTNAVAKAGTKKSVDEGETADIFKTITEQGVWVGEVDGVTRESRTITGASLSNVNGSGDSDEIKEDYPFVLLAYEHPTLGFGEHANLPMLQELPDSMTSGIWGSWVEINPRTAASLGIKDGDLVEVKSYHGSVRAPAVLYPAIRPEVIAMPYGQGHSAYGRYAKDKGANPILVNPYAVNSDTSAVRVKLSRVSSDGKLIRFGTNATEQIERRR